MLKNTINCFLIKKNNILKWNQIFFNFSSFAVIVSTRSGRSDRALSCRTWFSARTMPLRTQRVPLSWRSTSLDSIVWTTHPTVPWTSVCSRRWSRDYEAATLTAARSSWQKHWRLCLHSIQSFMMTYSKNGSHATGSVLQRKVTILRRFRWWRLVWR